MELQRELDAILSRVRLGVVELEVARAQLANGPTYIDGEVRYRSRQPVAARLRRRNLLDGEGPILVQENREADTRIADGPGVGFGSSVDIGVASLEEAHFFSQDELGKK